MTANQKYVVLARRYRPTRFEEVVGQGHVTRTLQNAIRAGRVHHAYLFTGARGVGKTTVARILARALNHPEGPTPNPPASENPEQEANNAVDMIEIDGASHTGVDDVRELRENVRYLPARSRYKIYIIDEVHMLSTSAFNALLKTLEEPPAHVIFVFATTEPHKIPATILSRCQRFDFKRVPTATIVAHLQSLLEREGVSVDDGGLGLIARAAEGCVRDALSLLDQVIAYAGGTAQVPSKQVAEVLGLADRRALFELSAALLRQDARAALSVVDGVFAQGLDLSQFAQSFLAHLRDLVVVATCAEPKALVEATDAELAELQAQTKETDGALFHQLFDRFAYTAEQIARSTFPRLLLEMAFVELAQLEPMLPLGDLLERLEGLERRVCRGGGVASTGGGGMSGLGRPPQDRSTSRGKRAGRASAASASAVLDTSDVQGSPPQAQAPTAQPPIADSPDPISETSETPQPATTKQQAPIERWRGLLRQLHGPAVGIYAAGRLLSWEDDGIELGYPEGGFELHSAADQQRQASFVQMCSEKLGRAIQLKVRALTQQEVASEEHAQYSAVEAQELEQRQRAEKLRQEARAHPATRALVEGLGAKIKSIKVDSNEAR